MMTSEPAGAVEEAYEYAGYYTQRWKTGRFHYALKSGRGIEKPRERDVEKSAALVMTRSIIAVCL
jgi:hypothetical protein